MSRQQRHLAAEAVFFFRGDEIVAAMKYDDFRDYLLNGRPVPPFRGETVRGVFTSVGDGLNVRAACLFKIDFDPEGRAPSDWSLPVRELAHNSGDGPDLGAGTIRVASRAQCSIPWHSSRLWAVEADEVEAALVQVQAAVRSNTIGLKVETEAQRVPSLLQARRRDAGDGRLAVVGGSDEGQDPPRRGRADAGAGRPRAEAGTRGRARAETERARAKTVELPANRIAEATRRFDDTFGPERRVCGEHLGGSDAEASVLARQRARHAAEIARLQSAHERQVSAMQSEIDRLRRLLRAASEEA
jgi:hypothetical protein